MRFPRHADGHIWPFTVIVPAVVRHENQIPTPYRMFCCGSDVRTVEMGCIYLYISFFYI